MSSEATKILAQFLYDHREVPLPELVVSKAKLCLLDYLGYTLAGSLLEHVGKLIRSVQPIAGPPQATVIGTALRIDAPHAALMNGAFGSTQLEDTAKSGFGHPGVGVIPAALATAEMVNASEADLLRAIVFGYEITMRVAAACGTRAFNKGWHPRGGPNAFGAAVAALSLLGIESAEMACNALGLAGTQASGLNEASFYYDGWHLLAGKAAHDGIMSALLARQGYSAGCTILEGRRGYLQAVSGSANPGKLTTGLGYQYQIMDVVQKVHASSALTHAAIDTILDLRARNQLQPGQIESIDIGTIDVYYLLDRMYPAHWLAASMNLPYLVAVAIADGQVSLEQLSPGRYTDPLLYDLSRRVTVHVDQESQAEVDRYLGATVKIYIKDGRVLEGTCRAPRGDPEQPLTLLDISEKFRRLSHGILNEQQKNNVIRAVVASDAQTRVRDIMRYLSVRSEESAPQQVEATVVADAGSG